ncbi:MAG TPA: AI-2E family transporter [Candidatus Paceibacterota bacterium]
MQAARERQFLVLLLGLFGVLAFFILKPFLAPLLLGAAFAVVLYPLYRRIHRLLGSWESLAAGCTVLLALLLVIASISLLGSQLLREAEGVYGSFSQGSVTASLESSLDSLAVRMDSYVAGSGESLRDAAARLDEYGRSALSWIVQHTGAALSSLTGAALSLFVFLLALFYLLRDGKRLARYIVDMSPLSDRDDEAVLSGLDRAVNSVVKGQLMIALIQSILTGVGFAIFGVPNAALWGAVTFLAALVPSVGTALVIGPGVAYLFVLGMPGAALGLAIWGIVAVGLVDNVLGPKLMGQGMRLHPLLVLLGVLGGIILLGPAGLFIGPLSLSLLLALLDLHAQLNETRA